mmetsp:Transcript_32393/g.96494  ORF Transcript_32393/g.96494 Transcript_32393/m.96494 type:complete len:237 (-) Transcript_32393:430-1140(-)
MCMMSRSSLRFSSLRARASLALFSTSAICASSRASASEVIAASWADCVSMRCCRCSCLALNMAAFFSRRCCTLRSFFSLYTLIIASSCSTSAASLARSSSSARFDSISSRFSASRRSTLCTLSRFSASKFSSTRVRIISVSSSRTLCSAALSIFRPANCSSRTFASAAFFAASSSSFASSSASKRRMASCSSWNHFASSSRSAMIRFLSSICRCRSVTASHSRNLEWSALTRSVAS